MAVDYGNRVSFLTPTTGTGTLNVGSPLSGFQLPAGASIVSGSTVGYTINDGTNWETGTGIYTSGSPPTLSRVTVEDSSIGPGSKITLSGAATVSFVLTAAQLASLYTSIGTSSPVSFLSVGTLWWNSNDGKLYVYTGTTWAEAANETLPIASSTVAGSVMVGSGLSIGGTGVLSNTNVDVGRNLLHNSMFNVQQRGAGAFTSSSVYTADRWLQYFLTSTLSTTIATLADADRTAIGDEAATYCLQCVSGGTGGAGDYIVAAEQRIEDVRRLGNKTITVSFWAKANTGTPKVGINLIQYSGGGSASVSVGSQSFTLSTTWTQYSATITMPSIIGMTMGASAHFTQFRFFTSSGATNNATAGLIGVQSYTLSLWGVQLEVSSVVTPLEKPDPRYDLANCQRFYQTNYFRSDVYGTGVNWNLTTAPLLVTMRAIPSGGGIATAGVTATNIASQAIVCNTAGSVTTQFTSAANGPCTYAGVYTLSVDL